MAKDNITPLQEAKLSFEELKQFATKSALKELENKVTEKVEKALNESINIVIDDDGKATIEKGDKVVELETNENGDTEIEVEDTIAHEKEVENNDEEESDIKELDEEITVEQEEPVPAPEQQEAPTPASTDLPPAESETPEIEQPEEKTPNDIDTIAQKLAGDIIDLIKATQGETNLETPEVVIDDEAQQETPAPAQQEAPAPAQQEAPAPAQQETPTPEQQLSEIDNENDEIFEITLDELESDNNDDAEIFEINLEEDDLINEKLNDEEYFEFDPNDEKSIEAMLSAVGDISQEKDDWKKDISTDNIPIAGDNEEEIDEIKGKSKPLTQGQNTLSKTPRQGTPNLNENKKTHKESIKIDELLKENKRLKESVTEMQNLIESYKNSFIDLRQQFDKMQTFNARLAYVNEIFLNKSLTTNEKAQINEQFEVVKTAEEAEKLFNSIIKESNNSKINKSLKHIKAPTTNNAKSKNNGEPLYESAEMKRRKVLAGIIKPEN